GITHDFLVTIRNKVSLQKDEWNNSIVVFMIKEDLDSITEGALDLSKKGAPFHTASLRKNLKHILENSQNNLEDYEKRILDFIVKNKFDDEFVKYTLMDFEAVFSIIEQGKIAEEDYYNLGVFKDKQLKSFKGKQVEARLEENKQLFDSVQAIHDRGNVKEQLEEKFAGKTINDLTSDEWYNT
ncbi:DNA-binding protein, partial [Paraburkholderia tropica]